MATFETRVEALTGLSIDSSSNPTQSELTQFLTDGANDVINRLKTINPVLVSLFSSTTVDGGSGAYIDGDVLGVFGAEADYDRPAEEVPFQMKSMVTNPNSLHYRSKYNPVFYREGKKIVVLPDGGSIQHISKPNVTYGAEDILDFPDQYLYMVALYAAIQSINNVLSKKEVPTELINLPTLPALPSFAPPSVVIPTIPSLIADPNIFYINASIQNDYSGSTNDISSLIAPTYNAPVLEAVTLETLDDLALPTPPPVPSIAAKAINFTQAAPAYTRPTLSTTTFPSFSDFTIDATAPTVPASPVFTAETVETTTIDSLPAPPLYDSPKVLGVSEELMETSPSADVAVINEDGADSLEKVLETAWAYVSGEEDPEMSNSALAFASNVVSVYGQAMANSLNHFNARSAEYTQAVQKVMQQAQFKAQEAAKQADINTQATLNEYTQELARFGQDLALFQANVSKEVQEWTTQNIQYKMAKWNTERSNDFQQYQSDMTNELNNFNKENAEYQAKLQISIQDAAAENQVEQAKLQEFSSDLQRHQAEVNDTVAEFTNNVLQKKLELYKFDYQQAIAKHSADMQNELNSFNEANVKYQAEIANSNTGFQSKINALNQKMQIGTTLDQTNKQQDIQARIQDYTFKIQKFQADLSQYQAEINTNTQEHGTKLQNFDKELSRFGQDLAKYQAEVQAKVQQHQTNLQGRQSEYSWLSARQSDLIRQYNESIGLQAQPKRGEINE